MISIIVSSNFTSTTSTLGAGHTWCFHMKIHFSRVEGWFIMKGFSFWQNGKEVSSKNQCTKKIVWGRILQTILGSKGVFGGSGLA